MTAGRTGPESASTPAPVPASGAAVDAVRRQMFLDFCTLLDREAIAYVILAGYRGYPDRIDSDVDFMVAEADFARLPALLARPEALPGARLLQMLRHETSACYFVLARQVGDRLAYLHPDAAASYRRRGRLWLRSADVLASRRRHPAGFWIPGEAQEFEYYVVKRIDKGAVEPRHIDALAELLGQAPVACQEVLSRVLPAVLAQGAADALRRGDATWFGQQMVALRAGLSASRPRESWWARWRHAAADARRLWARVTQPTGLVLSVLGPDGSGKTTVIDHLERELAPAFRRTRRFHFRPRLGRPSPGGTVSNPHAQRPRGVVSSSAKVALFVADYVGSWLAVVAPAVRRSTLVIFDRYFHDMLADPVRYRLPPGLVPVASAASAIVPRPDVWLVLLAPPATLVARKGEVTEADARELVSRYQALAAAHADRASLLDTTSPLPDTLAAAVRCVADHLHRRAMGRVGRA